RSPIHFSSFHLWAASQTREAVFGGCSQYRAKGSAFSVHKSLLWEWILYLYLVPRSSPGMNPSQIPLPSHRTKSTCSPALQWLKSPTTDTDWAEGAQTAK